ncbi:MAG TPA: glycosyl transferase family 2 [Cyanobacteria bacterium UBA8803]|nr:glycosyl transferase family 2 [Cyanobacteria bacterium UBA9273]HBL57555.1 glycosyl transferase family 2 [Cyanobacteria bacterium UBA8803]
MIVQISAIICTHNRAKYLHKAIQSLVEQTLNRELYEILVIDNRSSDNTKQVVTEEFAHVGNLRYLYEPILGLSQARNTGWQQAKGEYVAYLDDDAIAYPPWLENILTAFKTITPQPGCVGGKIEPIWEDQKPDWLPPQFLPYLTIIDWSDVPIILDSNQYIGGANMAFPKFLLAAVGGFDINLGRRGRNLMSNEELLMRDLLKERDYAIYYDPAICVRHHIDPSRLTKDWFIQRHYWQGVSDAVTLIRRQSLNVRQRISLGMTKLNKLLKSPKKFAYLVLPTPNVNRLWLKCDTWKQLGYIWGLLSEQ